MGLFNMSGAPNPTCGTHVPLYIYPSAGSGINSWQTYANLFNQYRVPGWVVLNDQNGDFTFADSNFVAARAIMKAANVKVLGYVYTSNGTRASATVKSKIDNYISSYTVDGIMLDEMDNITGHEAYYQDITDYIHSNISGGLSVGNPGTVTAQTYVNTVDVIKIYENSGYPTVSTIQSRTFNGAYSKTKFGITIHSATSLDVGLINSFSSLVGYIFVTDGTTPNPYNLVSAYSSPLMSRLVTLGCI